MSPANVNALIREERAKARREAIEECARVVVEIGPPWDCVGNKILRKIADNMRMLYRLDSPVEGTSKLPTNSAPQTEREWLEHIERLMEEHRDRKPGNVLLMVRDAIQAALAPDVAPAPRTWTRGEIEAAMEAARQEWQALRVALPCQEWVDSFMMALGLDSPVEGK